MNFFKIITFATFLLNWIESASQDGKIDGEELAEVVKKAAELIEIRIDIDW